MRRHCCVCPFRFKGERRENYLQLSEYISFGQHKDTLEAIIFYTCINSAHIPSDSTHFQNPVYNVCTHLNTNYMFVWCILIQFRLICRSSVKRLCFGKRMFTTSFVLLNAPLSALDTEQHCGIGYRLKASRKNHQDDGECASICSQN